MGRILVVMGLVVLAAGSGWLVRGWSIDPTSSAKEKTSTCHVVRGRLEQNVKARGIVKPGPTALVRLGFPFPKDQARTISRLSVVEGDRIEPGAELAQLDHEDLKAALRQLEGDLQVFERRLEASKTLEPVEVRLAEATLAERKAQREHAQRIHDRLVKLVRTAAASIEQGEVAATDLAVAQAKAEQAEVGVEQIRLKYRTDIATLAAQIKQAQAAMQTVEVQIRWSQQRSPLAVPAQVFAVHQRQGELTSGQPTVPVLTLLDPDQLQVHLYVDEADFGRIRLDQAVALRVESYPDQILNGKIVRLLPQPVLQENVVYYLAVVEVVAEQRSLLRAEMTTLAHVQAGIKEAALWLPLAAVRSRPHGWFVLRPDGAQTPVRIGWKDQGRVEIRQGLSEGDEVILD